VNYRANIQALNSSNITNILSVGTVGSMKKTIKPGDFVIPHDFIDFSKSRPLTFFDDNRIHVDMTDPFCPALRNLIINISNNIENLNFHDKGIYISTEGPRLESVSEINFFSEYADIVGMTLIPEIVLARERGMCYGSFCIVCNMAAGFQNQLNADEIIEIYNEKEKTIIDLLKSVIESINKKNNCYCFQDLSKALL